MKKGFVEFWMVMLFVFAYASPSLAIDMGIITGGKKGTYYQFGLNLHELVKTEGIQLSVYNSTGSIRKPLRGLQDTSNSNGNCAVRCFSFCVPGSIQSIVKANCE